MKNSPWGLLARVLCLLTMIGSPLAAQMLGQDGEAPEVERITIEYGELKNVSRENILAHVQLREGMDYDQNLVDRSIRSLYGTRLFDFVEARVEELDSGGVELIFSVESKYRIQEINFSGNEEFSDNRLEDKTEARAGEVLDERLIRNDRDAIVEYYEKKGYTQIEVDYDIERNVQTGLGTVTYRINEGPKLSIEAIEFVGNQAIDDDDLRDEMETNTWRWWISWITGSGRFDEKTFQEDLDRLRSYYKDRGYLDVNISESEVTLEYPEEDEIVIRIPIDEGRQYRVGEIEVEGAEIFEEDVITRALHLIPGDVFSPTELEEDRGRIVDLYGSVGYLDTNVRPERIPNVETGNIDLVYHIEEGEKFYVESINIEGNTKTKSVVILRELALSPGRVFNLVWMKNSEARLKNTRFFDEVSLTPEPTNIPGRRDLKVSVKEARTGQFQFGAGFSSLENVVVFVELTQGNFDLFNHRSFFQGDGQKFRFRASVGSRSSEVIIAFEEPWVFEQRLAAGFELYRRETDYNSSLYDEVRTGLEVYLRKRLFELVDARLSYRIETVEIDEIARNAPAVIRAEDGTRMVSKVGLTLSRDTRNDFIFTTRGSRVSLMTEFAGLGGDTRYISLETRNAFFLPTFETGDQVLAILARAGTFISYDEEYESFSIGRTTNDLGFPVDQEIQVETSVPFFDRYYLGGPNSLRGFDYREIAPRAPDYVTEPIGGRSYGFGSLEYTVKLGEPIRVAVFYDWGFVNADDFDFNPSGFADNWGVGVRILVLGNPLRLDLGFPLTSPSYEDIYGREDSSDEGMQFNFSFGTRF